jgi:ribosomal protein S18 acetylase RimI-like enzyme
MATLGVHPDQQGQGHGRALLNTVNGIVDADLDSIGIRLETNNPVNVLFYRHFGYDVVSNERIEPIDIWCMFRMSTPYPKP